jgi:hypothetical protein
VSLGNAGLIRYQRYRTEPRCRTEAADSRKKCRCLTNFYPAFRHLQMIFQYQIARITPSAAVYGRAGCITFHYLQFGRALGIPFTTTNNSFFKCRNVGLSVIQSVRYRNEQKLRCRNQSGTGIRGQSLVTKCSGTGCRNADAGGISLDADAQLYLLCFIPTLSSLLWRCTC